MSPDSPWRSSEDGLVSRWTLDSADRRQTLSPDLLWELAAGARLAASRGARVVAVDSAVGRIFAAGAPLEMIRSLRSASAWEFSRTGQQALEALSRVPAWIVAEIEGACAGGGLDLAIACDLRIASSSSTFAHPGVRLGIVTGWGGTWRVRQRAGLGAARKIFERGETISGGEALRLGLVDEVVPAANFRERCDVIERALARGLEAGVFKGKQ